MLTSDEVEKIAVDVMLGRPLRVKGTEAEEMAASIKQDFEAAKSKRLTLEIPFEIPSVK